MGRVDPVAGGPWIHVHHRLVDLEGGGTGAYGSISIRPSALTGRKGRLPLELPHRATAIPSGRPCSVGGLPEPAPFAYNVSLGQTLRPLSGDM